MYSCNTVRFYSRCSKSMFILIVHYGILIAMLLSTNVNREVQMIQRIFTDSEANDRFLALACTIKQAYKNNSPAPISGSRAKSIASSYMLMNQDGPVVSFKHIDTRQYVSIHYNAVCEAIKNLNLEAAC